jgi:hypothetical protein
MFKHCVAQDSHHGKGTPADPGQTLPQHVNGPKLQRQKTLLQRVVGKRLTHAATMRLAPIKHDADYAGKSPSGWCSDAARLFSTFAGYSCAQNLWQARHDCSSYLQLNDSCNVSPAEWLSQKVDKYSLFFLLVAYIAILIAILVA